MVNRPCKNCIHEEACKTANPDMVKKTYQCKHHTPTADVVEVVRCKDCDVPHNRWTGCPNLNGLIPPPDFYCAKGTPKERGGEK